MQHSFRPRSENLVRTGLNLTNFSRFSAYSVLQNLQQSEIELAIAVSLYVINTDKVFYKAGEIGLRRHQFALSRFLPGLKTILFFAP
jgi:hypothetical protein